MQSVWYNSVQFLYHPIVSKSQSTTTHEKIYVLTPDRMNRWDVRAMATSSFAGGAVCGSYAGDFDCSVCRQKRLTAEFFSKSMQAKRRANPSAPLKCRECVATAAEAERAKAVAAAATIPDDAVKQFDEPITCSTCKLERQTACFTAKQRSKLLNARCADCITKAEEAERSSTENPAGDALRAAQAESERAVKSGSAADRLRAAAAEAAAEATMVTGLKPLKMGLGRGGSRRGRGVGRGTAIARGGRGRAAAKSAAKVSDDWM
jgi:hypothetical protein